MIYIYIYLYLCIYNILKQNGENNTWRCTHGDHCMFAGQCCVNIGNILQKVQKKVGQIPWKKGQIDRTCLECHEGATPSRSRMMSESEGCHCRLRPFESGVLLSNGRSGRRGDRLRLRFGERATWIYPSLLFHDPSNCFEGKKPRDRVFSKSRRRASYRTHRRLPTPFPPGRCP